MRTATMALISGISLAVVAGLFVLAQGRGGFFAPQPADTASTNEVRVPYREVQTRFPGFRKKGGGSLDLPRITVINNLEELAKYWQEVHDDDAGQYIPPANLSETAGGVNFSTERLVIMHPSVARSPNRIQLEKVIRSNGIIEVHLVERQVGGIAVAWQKQLSIAIPRGPEKVVLKQERA